MIGLFDITKLKGDPITIAGVAFEHRLFHFRLSYSGWSHVEVIQQLLERGSLMVSCCGLSSLTVRHIQGDRFRCDEGEEPSLVRSLQPRRVLPSQINLSRPPTPTATLAIVQFLMAAQTAVTSTCRKKHWRP